MIALKGIQMPENCKSCPFVTASNLTGAAICFINDEQVNPHTKYEGCPLIETKDDAGAESTILKPCPFCGGEVVSTRDADWFFEWHIIHKNEDGCFIDIGTHFETENAAADAWNRREGEKND